MECPHQTPKSKIRQFWISLTHSAFVIGLLSLVWFVLRTGTKPTRAAYPCQRAAAASSTAWLAAYVVPFLPFVRVLKERKWDRRAAVGVLVSLVAVAGITWVALQPNVGSTGDGGTSFPVALTLPKIRSSSPMASDLFVVQGVTPEDSGIPDLISLMSANGVRFYRSEDSGIGRSPDGLIDADDVVLIKVNCQWDQRGGTNTDLVRALISAIVDHPSGFTGEIVIADNGQAQYGSRGSGGSLNWSRNNAEARTQSIQDVVSGFATEHVVSTFLWDTITGTRVDEYDQQDMEDGYVVQDVADSPSGMAVTYPKFETSHGTYVSFKCGIWDPASASYDSTRLKVINLPVLKPHMIYGVTGCVKHYMGVVSDRLSSSAGTRAHNAVTTGGMGTALAETRFPTLNILDAIHVCLEPGQGPMVYYTDTTHLGIVAASTDPVALDYWAATYILIPGAEQRGHAANTFSPDLSRPFPGSFARYLDASREILQQSGFRVTSDEDTMNVFVTLNES
ncbi:DUF362 domain-containing protein [Candidatus Bipolaricaulota bacterium]